MLFKIESYHNGGAYALDLLCFRINHPLCEMKTFGADFSNGCLYSDMIRTINLCKEVRFYMYDDNAVFLSIDVRAYGSKVLGFSQIIEREINRIIHVAEFIDIIKS